MFGNQAKYVGILYVTAQSTHYTVQLTILGIHDTIFFF